MDDCHLWKDQSKSISSELIGNLIENIFEIQKETKSDPRCKKRIHRKSQKRIGHDVKDRVQGIDEEDIPDTLWKKSVLY